MSQPLTKQETHNLAMNIVGEELQKEGFEFLAINSDLKKNPQFVTLKNKETSFVVVRPVPTVEVIQDYNTVNMKPIVEHAKTHNATVFYAGVFLGHGTDINLPILNGEEYSFVYVGLTEVL